MKKPAQDAPGTTIGTSDDRQVPPISRLAYAQRSCSSLNVIENLRAVEDGVDAAVPVDAKNAPTSDLQNRKERGFAQRPHRSSFFSEEENRRTNDKTEAASVPIQTVSTEGFTAA